MTPSVAKHMDSQFKGTDREYQCCCYYINNENTMVEVCISSFIPARLLEILPRFSAAQSQEHACLYTYQDVCG